MDRESLKILVSLSSGLLVGGFIGYAVTQRVLSDKFEKTLDKEVAALKEVYKKLYSEKDEAPEEEVAPEQPPEEIEYWDTVEEEGYDTEDHEDYDDKPVKVVSSEPGTKLKDNLTGLSVDENGRYVPPIAGAPLIDYNSKAYKELIKGRSADRPYVITVDEFMEENDHFEKQSLMWFEGDQTLCDERDLPIDDIAGSVGRDNLDRFGEFSKDDSIVYIRNERIASDFEVAFHPTTYIESIAGFKYRKAKDEAIITGETFHREMD